MRCLLDGLNVVEDGLDALARDVYSIKVDISHRLIFGQSVIEFVTIVRVLVGSLAFFSLVWHVL